MRRRVVVIAAFLATLLAAIGITATSSQASTGDYLENGAGYCLHDTGHNKVMNTSATCITYFTFPLQAHINGLNWYFMKINGGPNCLNYDPNNGWVYDDSCQAGDMNEYWQHHYGNDWIDFNSSLPLAACNATSSAAIYAATTPLRCASNAYLKIWYANPA